MDDFLTGLNPKQAEAVQSPSQYIRVIAGAGSGKTRVLTSKIFYFIQTLGIPPSSIYGITFTNKAANEMLARIKKSALCPPSSLPKISTIHSLCANILRQDIDRLGYRRGFIIIDEDEQNKIIKDLIDQPAVIAKEIIAFIQDFKEKGIAPDQLNKDKYIYINQQRAVEVYPQYQKYLFEHNYLDFSDLINLTNIVLDIPSVQQKWQGQIKALCVDEFQDTSANQYNLIKKLLGQDTFLFVVGDPDQNIYSWRGADVSIILDLKKDFPSLTNIILNQNYRSTKAILQCSNQLIKHNQNRFKKELFTTNEQAEQVKIISAVSDTLEAKNVCAEIKRLLTMGYKYTDIAILFRSNYLSRPFEMALIENHIPYNIYGTVNFFDRKEIKDILAYLRLINNQNDVLALERIINMPRRGFSIDRFDRCKEEAELAGLSVYDLIKEQLESYPPSLKEKMKKFFTLIEDCKEKLDLDTLISDLIPYIGHHSGYIEMILNKDETERMENIQAFQGYIREYETTTNTTLEDFIQNIALFTSQDIDYKKEGVKMMSVHLSKGLEFKVVFVIAVCDDIFPNHKSELEEERRLCYVAFTRAQERLYVCYRHGFNYITSKANVPSVFIKEAGLTTTPNSFGSKSPSTFNNKALFKAGDRVVHTTRGEGIIMHIEGQNGMIFFTNSGESVKMRIPHPMLERK